MSKENDAQKNTSDFPHQNLIVRNSNIFYPTQNLLYKPDFSPLINGENKFLLKINGSYKKPINIEPESPVKGQNTNYVTLTPIKIKGREIIINFARN